MEIRLLKNTDIEQIKNFELIGSVIGDIDFNDYTYKYVAVDNNEVIGFLYAARAERALCYSLGD